MSLVLEQRLNAVVITTSHEATVFTGLLVEDAVLFVVGDTFDGDDLSKRYDV